MTNDNTLFNNEQPEPTGEENQPNPLAEQLAKIVDGEGKQKYDSIEKALASIPNAQQHISTLEQENAKLREIAEKSSKIDEVLAKLQEQKPETPSVKGLEEKDVAQLVDNLLTQKAQEVKAKENASIVVGRMRELYGDKAEETYNKLASDLEMTVEEMNSLVQSKPKAALRLMGIADKTAPSVPKSTGTVNQSNFATPAPAKPKSVMGPSSTADELAAWRAAAPQD